jgi:hypothetical protein
VSVSDLYIPTTERPILLLEICGPILGIYIAHRYMNVEIGTDATQFPEKELINEIFFAVRFCNGVCEGKYYSVKKQTILGPSRKSGILQKNSNKNWMLL